MSDIPAGYTVDWYRVPLPPGRLEELNRRSDLRGLMRAGGHLALIVAGIAAAVWAAEGRHWWWLAAILYLHGTVYAFLGNAMHELTHGTVFRSRWLTSLFLHVFSFLSWANHHTAASHAEHHTFTLHYPHDQEVVVPMRMRLVDVVTAALPRPWEIIGTIRGHWRMACGRLDGPWMQHLFAGKPSRFAVASWSRRVLIGHAALAVGCIATGWWIIPVTTSLAPTYGRVLQWLLNNTQHAGLPDGVRDFRLNCRTIEINPLFGSLYWHMNYHIEHHMYAAVPCYRLRELRQAIIHEMPPAPRGLVAAWFELIALNERQREEPGWAFRPALPARQS